VLGFWEHLVVCSPCGNGKTGSTASYNDIVKLPRRKGCSIGRNAPLQYIGRNGCPKEGECRPSKCTAHDKQVKRGEGGGDTLPTDAQPSFYSRIARCTAVLPFLSDKLQEDSIPTPIPIPITH
jgi:hypothetical protein